MQNRMSLKIQERRLDQRIEATIDINYRIAKNIFSITTSSKDISLGGISFFAQHRVNKGVLLELSMSFSGGLNCLEMPVSVIWRSDSNNIRFPFVVGVKFNNLKNSQQSIINNYIRQHPN